MSNLPNWPGAAAVYSRAYKVLEYMAQNGHVTRTFFRRWYCTVSEEMSYFIDALNEGDEEKIKAFLMWNRNATDYPEQSNEICM